jgi:hypothetical protein
MTHIFEKKENWRAVFSSYSCNDDGELFLHLEDGTIRKMNNWGEDTLQTKRNLEELNVGDHVEIITWGGRSKDEWFCDVKKC